MRIFWDWDRTLGTKSFWYKLSTEDSEFAACLNEMFASESVRSWMRGELSFDDMHQRFLANYDKVYLRERLVSDWKISEVFNDYLWKKVTDKYPGAVHYVVTDNMDVFNDFVADNKRFFNRFNKVYNSSDYGALKSDEEGLLCKVLTETRRGSFRGDLLLDDSRENCETFESLGGNAILVPSAR